MRCFCASALLTLLALASHAPPVIAGSRSCADPTNYCLSAPNSVGPGAVISWWGTPDLQTDDFQLVVTGCPPSQFLMFYYGAGPTQTPFGNGWRCVGAGGVGIFRFTPLQVNSGGTAVMKVDYDQPPAGTGGGTGQWRPGDTWYCQGWYRDPAGGGAMFNLTDGLDVPICLNAGLYDQMVPVPAGEFEMGRHAGSGTSDELPVHAVYLDAYYIDVCEVSNQQYADYLNTAYGQDRIRVIGGVVYRNGGAGEAICDTTTGSSYGHITWDAATSTFGVASNREEHPMVVVSWFGACTYANQKSRDHGLTPCYDEMSWTCDFGADGYRLPTEAEWEYAARGGEHNPYFMYPWGNAIDGSCANYSGSGDPYEGNSPGTTPVGYYDGNQTPPGAHMANGYGLYDTSGNAWEWCWDWYDLNYYSSSPYDNPTGPGSGSYRVVRGGGWYNATVNLRSAKRNGDDPAYRSGDIGFRVLAVHP